MTVPEKNLRGDRAGLPGCVGAEWAVPSRREAGPTRMRGTATRCDCPQDGGTGRVGTPLRRSQCRATRLSLKQGGLKQWSRARDLGSFNFCMAKHAYVLVLQQRDSDSGRQQPHRASKQFGVLVFRTIPQTAHQRTVQHTLATIFLHAAGRSPLRAICGELFLSARPSSALEARPTRSSAGRSGRIHTREQQQQQRRRRRGVLCWDCFERTRHTAERGQRQSMS